MSIFDRFKKPVVPEAVAPVIVEKLVEVEKIVKVESSDRDLLAAILVELRLANDLKLWRLNPDDPKRTFAQNMREGQSR